MPKTALTSGQRTNEGQRVGRKHSECTCSTFFRSSWRVALRTFRFERGLHGIGLLASLSLAPVQRGWKGGRVAKPFPQLLSLHALEPNGAFSSSLAFAHFFTNVRECCTRIAWRMVHAYRLERVCCIVLARLTEPKNPFRHHYS